MTEPGAGSDVAGIKTRAVKKGDEVRWCLYNVAKHSNLHVHQSLQIVNSIPSYSSQQFCQNAQGLVKLRFSSNQMRFCLGKATVQYLKSTTQGKTAANAQTVVSGPATWVG